MPDGPERAGPDAIEPIAGAEPTAPRGPDPADSPLARQREKARRVATTIVALAMGLAGLMMITLAVVLVWQGGGGLILLGILIGLFGIALAAAGFFFQLVPLRVDELAEEKRAYDRRIKEQP